MIFPYLLYFPFYTKHLQFNLIILTLSLQNITLLQPAKIG